MAQVAILMGSAHDLPAVKAACETLERLGIRYDVRLLSAHRTPDAAAAFAKGAREAGFQVLICAAGMAAHLAGVVAAHTTLPVIGVPLRGGALDGLDALLSTAQMPSGVPVATVSLDGAKNAALLAAEILALTDPALTDALERTRREMAEGVAADEARVRAQLGL